MNKSQTDFRLSKIEDHIELALTHLDQADLPIYRKVEIEGLLEQAKRVLREFSRKER